MIEVKNVTKRFDKFTAIDNISFKIESGSVYGLAGYNGAGKTTLIKTIAGLYRPEEGKALLDGEVAYNSDKSRERLFFVPDDMFFLPGATMQKMAKFYKGYYPNFSMKIFDNLTELFKLDKNKRMRGFSKGMQRQAEIIFALSSRPKNLLLDECFDGLDPQKRNLTKKLFLEYVAESECSVLVSSHNLSELSELCDHIGLINGKTLIVNTGVDDVSRDYRKFRVVFNETADAESIAAVLEGVNFRDFSIEGNIAAFVVNGDIPAIKTKIETLNPSFIEEIPLRLENVFMYEMEGEKYELSEIFN